MVVLNHRDILDRLVVPVLVLDDRATIAYANEASATLVGESVDELIGRRLHLAGTDPSRPAGGGEPSVDGEPASSWPADGPTQLEFRTRGGERIPVEVAPGGSFVGADPACRLQVATLQRRPDAGQDEAAVAFQLAHGLRTALESTTEGEPIPDRQAWLQVVAESLVRDFDAALVRIWLADPQHEGGPTLAVAVGPSRVGRPEVADAHWPSEAWSKVLWEECGAGGFRWGADVLASRAGFDRAWLADERIVSLVVLPMRCGGERQGLLTFYSRRAVTDNLMAALGILAAVAAVGLRDIHLGELAHSARIEADRQYEKLRGVLDVLPVAVIVVEGPDGRVGLMNAAARTILAGEPTIEELDSLAALHDRLPLIHLDGRPYAEHDRPLWRTLHHGDHVREVLKLDGTEGREAVFEVASAPLPGFESGAVTAYRDVTEEHRLRYDLADRASQLKLLLDNLPVGVAYFDNQGVCRASNGPARKLLGRTREWLSGVTADELFRPTPALRDALARCVRDAVPHVEGSTPWPDPAGSYGTRYLDWRFQPLSGKPGGSVPGVLALIVDVTERKLTADRLRKAADAAFQASRYKSQFLSAVSHDLRTPVNALSLQAEWLAIIAGRHEDADPELASLASDIRASAANLVELVNDLLELTLFDAGVLEYQPTDFPLDDWLDSTLAPLRAQARAKGLTLAWRVDQHGRMAHADRVKLGRVLVNLVGNAVKFTETGSVEVEAGESPERGLLLTVRDTGPGIPSDQLERIFDEFAQLRNPERDRTKGTGLGLAISRRLISGAGGRLVVESQIGRGSTFQAFYPADHLVDTTAALRREVLGPPGPISSPGGRNQGASLLLVEDDPFSRHSLARLLERKGFKVEAVEDGPRALERIQASRPDLVLLDLMLPQMDGAEVLRRIRRDADRDALPVIVLSGDVLSGRSNELRSMDVNGIIAKPVDLDELHEMIRYCLSTTTRP